MRITFICPVYPPEVLPSGVMLSQLARHFVSIGHDVMVYTTFPSLPGGRVFPGYRRYLWKSTNQNGVRLTRCFSFVYGPTRKPLRRVLSHLSFTVTSAARLLLDRRPNAIIVETLPIISTTWLVALAKILGVPVVNYIKDLFPEAAEDAGMIKTGGAVSNIAKWVDRMSCRYADMNLVLSDSFKEALTRSRQIPEHKIEIIKDWIDGSQISPMNRTNPWRVAQKIPDETFVAMFAGTVGLASGADVIVDAARELRIRGHEGILIVCIGEGILKLPMMEKAKRLNLDNIRFLPFQPEERLAEVQSAADVMLLTMSERHVFSSVPSKLITYMAVGRPVICSADRASAVAQLVSSIEIGVVIPPGDTTALADALIDMDAKRDEWVDAGKRAREFFEKNNNLPVALEKFDHLLMTITHGRNCN
jgi:colanic acid biosynthesis glycosyl transferase WcaI